MAVESLPRLHELITKFNTSGTSHQEHPESRGDLIRLVGSLYERTKNQPALFPSSTRPDVYLARAEGVVNLNHFSAFPGSRARLLPLAASYVQHWNGLLSSVQQFVSHSMDEAALLAGTEAFVLSHQLFSKQLLSEIKLCSPHSDLGARLHLPLSLAVFYSLLLEYVSAHPERSEHLNEMLDASDQEVFYLIPRVVLFQWIKHKDLPCPELFESFKSELTEACELYSHLDIEQKAHLESVIFDPSGELDEEGKTFFKKVRELSCHLHGNGRIQSFTDCCRILTKELGLDFDIAQEFRPHLKDSKLPFGWDASLEQNIFALLHLPLDSFRKLHPILPALKEMENCHVKFSAAQEAFKMDVEDFLLRDGKISSDGELVVIGSLMNRLKKDPRLYRLLGILELSCLDV